MTITEKSAYLRGLVEGLNVDPQTKEGKIFKCMVEIIDDMALTMADLEDTSAAFAEELDELYEELDEMYEDDDLCEVECPECGETIVIDESVCDDGVIECPSCGKQVDINCCCDDDCGCSCGCEEDSKDN